MTFKTFMVKVWTILRLPTLLSLGFVLILGYDWNQPTTAQPRSPSLLTNLVPDTVSPVVPDASGLPAHNTYTLPLDSNVPVSLISAPLVPIPLESFPLSPGDQMRVLVADGEIFSGVYLINLNGEIQIPYLTPLKVGGLTLLEAQTLIREQLVKQKMFKPGYVRVSVGIIQWGIAEVNVSGAVFQPGPVTLNVRPPEEQALTKDRVSGDIAPERSLVAALRSAGGITPLANLKETTVIRNRQTYRVDLSGVFLGQPLQNIPLIRGDRVIVPTTGVWQNELVRPSPITLPALQIRISNLTVPANSNSNSSVSRDAITFPYGTRFGQAVVSGNCVGGTQATNANRYAILVRTDRLTGSTRVYESAIEDLMRSGNDDINPFLMPDDGVACYDSTVTNVRDVFNSLTNIFSPIELLRGIFGW
ncbi:MAG: polysaccharide biosynthesis/export family protein [Microcystaceae cyanobacterium]